MVRRIVRRRRVIRRPMGMGRRRVVRRRVIRRPIRRSIGMGHRRVSHRRTYGMGHRRVSHRRTYGRGILDSLRSAHDYVKKNRLVSRGANLLGFKTASKAAHLLGYGAGRRRVHHRVHHRRVGGRVVFPSVWTTGLGGLSATTG